MALYILSYTKNMEFRNSMVEFYKIKETIDMLKDYNIEVAYITQVKEDDTEVKRLLGVYKRTNKQSLKWKYGNEIARTCNVFGNVPITVDKFLRKEILKDD